MASAKVRENGDGTYDVVFVGVTKPEAMAIREGFSALDVNQKWAYANQGSLTNAVRGNTILAALHDEYKATIRDVPPPVVYEEEEELDIEEDYEEEDEWEAIGFSA